MGSTNYGKLTNVSFQFGASVDAQTSAAATGTLAVPGVLATSGAPIAQIFETIILGLNHNIVRISGGALGFPIL
jgi:triosephosphate isomerase